MPGRPLCNDKEATARGYVGHANARRRAVLRETLEAFERAGDAYHRLASRNLERWRATAEPNAGLRVEVLQADWGEATRGLTARYGQCFAVLNMANPHFPGGSYTAGGVAMEENMFRRTDCHFQISDEEYDQMTDEYRLETALLLLAHDGMVYLDAKKPRVCIRGPEDRSRPDLGYAWLQDDDIFPFLELRASAQDLRGGQPFDEAEARRRISAQFATLLHHGVKHILFSAFGCGVYANPAHRVASIYRDEIQKHGSAFSVIAFAIFHAGYGANNFAPFKKALGDLG